LQSPNRTRDRKAPNVKAGGISSFIKPILIIIHTKTRKKITHTERDEEMIEWVRDNRDHKIIASEENIPYFRDVPIETHNFDWKNIRG
jgi:hypothetical protein